MSIARHPLIMFGTKPTGASFDADYQALLTYATGLGYALPTAPQQTLQNALVLALKANGIWSELDYLTVPASNGSTNFKRLNWKTPSLYTASLVNSPTVTDNIGFIGNGSTAYVDTNFNPVTHGVKHIYTDYSIFLAVTKKQAVGALNKTLFGNDGFPASPRGRQYVQPTSSTQFRWWTDDSDKIDVVTTDYEVDNWQLTRNGSNKTVYKNGTSVGTGTNTPDVFTSLSYFALSANRGGTPVSPTEGGLGVVALGSNLNSVAAAYNSAINTYLTSL